MSEYLSERERIGSLTLKNLTNVWFTAAQFVAKFKSISLEEDVCVETPYSTKEVGLHLQPVGGHRFIDWHERVYRYLRTQVRRGKLYEKKENGRCLFYVAN